MKNKKKVEDNIENGNSLPKMVGDFEDIGGLENIGTINNDFKIPSWWDCVWKRVPCEKNECKICGKIKEDRQKHINKGENPDAPELFIEDIKNNFKDVLKMIKKDAERLGIDIDNLEDLENMEEPPEPKEFLLYNNLVEWRKSVRDLIGQSEIENKTWVQLEAVQDLIWYSNTLLTKTYRQLCNKWYIENGDEYGQVDYEYTGYVIGEVFNFLDKAVGEIMMFESQFIFIDAQLKSFKKSIIEETKLK
ncbi:MAG: hypothetical protein PHX25_03090 [Candidatus Pacebacteria bacterium]|nr:hypothetical protein [Candidatus Paceibacterota bacterium]